MIRFIIAVVLLFPVSAWAQSGSVKTKPQLTTEISANLPDNAGGTITPFTVRQTLLDMLVSSSSAQKSTLTTEIGTNLPDNTTGVITALALRQTLLDFLNNLALLATQSQSALIAEVKTNITATVTPALLRTTLSDLVTGMQLVSAEPCDLITCGEAWSVTRGMIASYNGPLFQLANGNGAGASTLDVGMSASRTVDMTTWSAFCSGVASNCYINKIYAQINGHTNDYVAVNFGSFNFCTAISIPCRSVFNIEGATGWPILQAGCGDVTDCNPNMLGRYSVNSGSDDGVITGITGGTHATTVIYNGLFRAEPVNHCCGSFGISHKYTAAQTDGSDFMVSLYCGDPNFFCFRIDGENNTSTPDFAYTGVTSLFSYVVLIDHDGAASPPSTSTIYYNGHTIWSQTTMQGLFVYNIPGPYSHLGGGGDIGNPAPIQWREGLITNSVLTAGEKAAVLSNNKAFYPLTFP